MEQIHKELAASDGRAHGATKSLAHCMNSGRFLTREVQSELGLVLN